MAVRLQQQTRLPAQMCSTVEQAHEIPKTTLDHLRRILSDHDYLKHSAPDKENNEEISRVLMEDSPKVEQKNVQRDIQNNSSFSISLDSKAENNKEQPNDGIQASDLSSLLHKFEKAIGDPASILTPATSPGHFENWSEPLSLKINSHANAIDFTPPTTPPVQEQPEQRQVQTSCKPSAVKNGAISKLPLEKNEVKVRGHKVVVKKSSKSQAAVSNKLKQKADEVESKAHEKEDIKLSKNWNSAHKRKFKDTLLSIVCSEKKAKTDAANKKEIDTKISENYKGSKIVLPKTSNKGERSTEKTVNEGSCVENSKHEAGELLSSANDSDIDSTIKGGSKKIVKGGMIDVPSSNEPKMCSNKEDTIELQIKRVKQSLYEMNSHDESEETFPMGNNSGEVHNNNNNETELKGDSCRMVSNNGESTGNEDGHKNDHHKRKNKDFDKTSKRKTDIYTEDRRKRRHTSKSNSNDEYSSEEERLKARKFEKHSCERGKEKYRKYSSRDDYDRKYSSRADEGRKYSNKERRPRNHDEHRERKPRKYVRDIEHERKIDFRLGRSSIRDVAKEERRVIYVGGLPYGTTRDELWKRFRKFGPIEKVTVHLRVGVRDNYGFVTFLEPEDARDCIERGNSDPTEPHYDLCFGGRREFCGGSYVDFDSTTSHIEELSETYGKVCDDVPEEDDFDSLLRMCQEGLSRVFKCDASPKTPW